MGGQKAAILAQVGQIYLDAVGQFCIGANRQIVKSNEVTTSLGSENVQRVIN